MWSRRGGLNAKNMGEDITKRFEYQVPNEVSVEKIKVSRKAIQDLAFLLDGSLVNSREKSLAITKLEEVSMWANKAIVFHQEG